MVLRKPYAVLKIEPVSVVCKALTPVYSLQSFMNFLLLQAAPVSSPLPFTGVEVVVVVMVLTRVAHLVLLLTKVGTFSLQCSFFLVWCRRF